MTGSTQPYHDPTFLREVWAWFAVGILVFIARVTVRYRKVGFRGFQGDDYMVIPTLACYIINSATVTIIYHGGSNVDFDQAHIDSFDAKQIAQVVYGSKLEFLAWNTYVAFLWALKASLLFFYNRLTFGFTQHAMVKLLAVVCACTYTAMFLTIMMSCRPISDNWKVQPLPPDRCTFRKQNFVVCTVLNTITDGLILSIPIPLLFKLRVPLHTRVLVGLLLCSGLFVISAAIIRIEMTFRANASALNINRWGIRETNVALMAVYAPVVKPIFTLHFWTGRHPRLRPGRSNPPAGNSGADSNSGGRSSGTRSSGFGKFGIGSLLRTTDSERAALTKAGNTTMKTETMATHHERAEEGPLAPTFSDQDCITPSAPPKVLQRMSVAEVTDAAHLGMKVESVSEHSCERMDSGGPPRSPVSTRARSEVDIERQEDALEARFDDGIVEELEMSSLSPPVGSFEHDQARGSARIPDSPVERHAQL